LVVEVRGQAAALDDEAGHDAMKNRAVKEPVIDVLEKVLDRDRGFLGEQLDGEGAVGSFKFDHGFSSRRGGPLPLGFGHTLVPGEIAVRAYVTKAACHKLTRYFRRLVGAVFEQ